MQRFAAPAHIRKPALGALETPGVKIAALRFNSHVFDVILQRLLQPIFSVRNFFHEARRARPLDYRLGRYAQNFCQFGCADFDFYFHINLQDFYFA